jgi:hypothetical protein
MTSGRSVKDPRWPGANSWLLRPGAMAMLVSVQPGKAQSWVARANSFARGVSGRRTPSKPHCQTSLTVPLDPERSQAKQVPTLLQYPTCLRRRKHGTQKQGWFLSLPAAGYCACTSALASVAGIMPCVAALNRPSAPTKKLLGMFTTSLYGAGSVSELNRTV